MHAVIGHGHAQMLGYHDDILAYPTLLSNDGIDNSLSSLLYISVDHMAVMASQLFPGMLFVKVDTESAYCLIPKYLQDHPLLVVQ